MKIEFTVPFRRVLAPRTLLLEPVPTPQGAPPRIARLLALAHKLDALLRTGKISGYVELARLGHISPARLTQIMVLLHLSPSIQEYILFLSAADARFITELGLRRIAREPRWDRQRNLSTSFLRIDLLLWRNRAMNVTRQQTPKERPQKCRPRRYPQRRPKRPALPNDAPTPHH
jgi:hypothetical protein